MIRPFIDTFNVLVYKGLVTNRKRGTSRRGYWIPAESLPRDVANQLGCKPEVARPNLGWDTHVRDWRDMVNAKGKEAIFATAMLVETPEGAKTVVLLDF